MVRKIVILIVILFIFTNKAFADGSSRVQIVSNSISPVGTFVGRKNILDKIKVNLNKYGVSYISGYGGIGKTQVVRKYIDLAQNTDQHYDVIWWIDCENNIDLQVNDLLEDMCDEFTNKTCKIKSNLRSALRNIRSILHQKRRKALLVVDNINSLQNIKKLRVELEREKDIDIIYISREEMYNKRDIKISTLNPIESRQYIVNFIGNILPEEISELNSIYQGYPILMEQGLSDILYNQDMNVKDHIAYQKKNFKEVVADRKTNYNLFNNKDYRYNFTDVLRSNIAFLKLHNKDSAKLLELLIYIGHKFDDNLLRIIAEDNLTKNLYSIGDIKKELTKRFFIKMQTKDSNNEYEIHPLLQEVMYKEIDDEEIHKDNIKILLKSFIKYLPVNIMDIPFFVSEEKIFISNLEKILEHADHLGIKNNDIFIIKTILAQGYAETYFYKEAERKIGEIEKDYINVLDNNDLGEIQKYKGLFYLVNGKIQQCLYWARAKATESFNKSVILTKNINDAQLRYLALAKLSQVYIYAGDIKNSKKYLVELEREQKDFLKEFSDKYTYHLVRGRHFLEEGKYPDAIKEFSQVEEIETRIHGEGSSRLMPILLLKADLLILMKEYKKAKEAIDLLFSICKENLGNYNIFMFRIPRINADLNLAIGDIEKAQQEIERAISFKGNSKNNYLADIYVTMGDILAINKNYQQALQKYEEANEIYMEQYNRKIETSQFSRLYEKIIKVALQENLLALANYYYNLHEKHFGISNNKTKTLFKMIESFKLNQN